MNRDEFMEQLARLLVDMPEAERMEAIRYYNDYFDEAGPENEGKVIQELGSAGRVAASIKANLQQEQADGNGTYQRTAGEPQTAGTYQNTGTSQEVRNRRPRSSGSWALLIVLLVFIGGPVILGVGGGLLGVLVGIVGGLFGVVVSVLTAGVGMAFGGVALFCKGIVRVFTSPAAGIVGMGSGLICMAIGLLFVVLFLWIVVRILPRLVRAAVNFCSRILYKIRGGATR